KKLTKRSKQRSLWFRCSTEFLRRIPQNFFQSCSNGPGCNNREIYRIKTLKTSKLRLFEDL
ncbi:unnamed protein product, partial [Brassica oleracea]